MSAVLIQKGKKLWEFHVYSDINGTDVNANAAEKCGMKGMITSRFPENARKNARSAGKSEAEGTALRIAGALSAAPPVMRITSGSRFLTSVKKYAVSAGKSGIQHIILCLSMGRTTVKCTSAARNAVTCRRKKKNSSVIQAAECAMSAMLRLPEDGLILFRTIPSIRPENTGTG